MSPQLASLLLALALLRWGQAMLCASAARLLEPALARALAGPGRRGTPALLMAGLAGAAMPCIATLARVLHPVVDAPGGPSAARALRLRVAAGCGAAFCALVLFGAAPWIAGPVTALGVALALARDGNRAGDAGRVLVALGLMLLALALLANGTRLELPPEIAELLAVLDAEPTLAAVAAFALALAMASPFVVVLVAAQLAAFGLVPPLAGVGLVLGAHAAAALLTLHGPPPEARPVAGAHAAVQTIVTAAGLLALEWLAPLDGPEIAASLPLAVHLLASAAVAALTLPLAGRLAVLARRLWPDPVPDIGRVRLDRQAIPDAGVALTCAVRELARLGDLVELMLAEMVQVVRHADPQAVAAFRRMDDAVDACYREVKDYLAAARCTLDRHEDDVRCAQLLEFAIALEQAADTADRLVHDVAQRTNPAQRRFSAAALDDIQRLHTMMMRSIRLAVRLLLEGKLHLALELHQASDAFKSEQRACARAHLQRLSSGDALSMASSSVYLDLLADFERINTLVSSVSEDFLRLREAAPALEQVA